MFINCIVGDFFFYLPPCSHLHEDSVLLHIIFGHLPSVSAPVGDHLCLAEGHLVHLLDMVVEVAGGTASVLADWADPWFGSTVMEDVNFKVSYPSYKT